MPYPLTWSFRDWQMQGGGTFELRKFLVVQIIWVGHLFLLKLTRKD